MEVNVLQVSSLPIHYTSMASVFLLKPGVKFVSIIQPQIGSKSDLSGHIYTNNFHSFAFSIYSVEDGRCMCIKCKPFLVRVSNHVFLCSQLDAGERALVRAMRTQVERMMNRHPESCDEVEEEEEEEGEGEEEEDEDEEEEEDEEEKEYEEEGSVEEE